MSLLNSLFASAKSLVSGNADNTNNFNLETDEKKIRVKFSVADIADVTLDEAVVTVRDAVNAAAKLSGTDLTDREYTVLLNGQPVSLDSSYVNGATYKLTFSAGTAG